MSENSSKTHNEVLWIGKPWILPSAIGRTLLVALLVVVLVYVELYLGFAYDKILGLPLILWTILVFGIIWSLSVTGLLLLRAAHTYILKKDSLEIKTGIASLKQVMIAPSGFSDLEVTQSLFERALGYGSIVIQTQSGKSSNKKMVKVKNPTKVAEQIRYIMARPIVRIDQPPGTQPKL
jgi:uncharacterized membrane protein YdbT with pleckstrin-like domain